MSGRQLAMLVALALLWGASYAILVTYLTPGVALLYGAIFPGEPVTGVTLGRLVLGGAGLGTAAIRAVRLRRRLPSEA